MTRWRTDHHDGVARHAPADAPAGASPDAAPGAPAGAAPGAPAGASGRGPGGAALDLAVHDAWDARAPEGLDHARYRAVLARQIRQDLWRALRAARGFRPVVEVASDHRGGAARVLVTAGGWLSCRPAPLAAMAGAARALLADPANRARWSRAAARAARRRPAEDARC